jgi:hypothetical protein
MMMVMSSFEEEGRAGSRCRYYGHVLVMGMVGMGSVWLVASMQSHALGSLPVHVPPPRNSGARSSRVGVAQNNV